MTWNSSGDSGARIGGFTLPSMRTIFEEVQ